VREILAQARLWLAEGKSVAVATVVQTWGSAPRPAGSKMAVSSAAEMAGSVSGGCVEGAVVEEALAVLKAGVPKSLHYGVTDDAAWEVGLACGGQLDLLVEPLAGWMTPTAGARSLLDGFESALGEGRPVARAVVLAGPGRWEWSSWLAESDGSLHGAVAKELEVAVGEGARAALRSGRPQTGTILTPEGEARVFYDVVLPPPVLVIVGGVHIAIDLHRLAKTLGYRVVVVDPRRAFGTPARFPLADELVSEWPDTGLRAIGLTGSTAVAVLSHDPKLDDPALLVALRSPAFYVGALGSAETNRQRRERLTEAGVTEAEMSRLRAPIGLPLGGRAPEEIALSILAEIVAARCGSPLIERPTG
jgi:xanthine dehydrogenase accessory factor